MTSFSTLSKHQLDIKSFEDYIRLDIIGGDGQNKEVRMKTKIDSLGTAITTFEVVTGTGLQTQTIELGTRLLDRAIGKYNEL